MRRLAVAVVWALAALAGSCQPRERPLVIFAAASLRDAFTAMSRDFAHVRPGVETSFNFAGTQELSTQLDHGAAADVFASADALHMHQLRQRGRVEAPVVFARNEPVLVVAKESAKEIRAFSDLPAARRIVIGAPEVPIGRYTLAILDRAGADFRARVEARVASRELNVRQVLTKVSLGEAQAGVVYRSDVRAVPGSVSVVEIPAELLVVAEYPMAVVKGTGRPELARAWLDFVLSPAGQRVLADAGFSPLAGGGP